MTTEAKEHKEGTPEQSIVAMQGEGEGGGEGKPFSNLCQAVRPLVRDLEPYP